MVHKIKRFDDPDLDRQLMEIITALNNFTLIHKTTGKEYTVEVDGATPGIVLTEVA